MREVSSCDSGLERSISSATTLPDREVYIIDLPFREEQGCT